MEPVVENQLPVGIPDYQQGFLFEVGFPSILPSVVAVPNFKEWRNMRIN